MVIKGLARSCLLLAGLLGTLLAQAQGESASLLDEVTVTATRIPVEWIRLPLAVGWVDQDEIQLGRQQLGLDEVAGQYPRGVFPESL